MSQIIDPDEMDDEAPTLPLWRRTNVRLGAVGLVLLCAIIYVRYGIGHTPTANPEKDMQDFIAASAPYEMPRPDAPTGQQIPKKQPDTQPQVQAPAPPHFALFDKPQMQSQQVPAQAAPQAPDIRGAMRNITPAITAVPHRSVMQSYDVPAAKPAPEAPKEPETTGIAFKAATLSGLEASPAIDETFILVPGLLPLVLDTAIDSNLPGPLLAHLVGPVYSPKGVLLMEGGSQVVGRYETMAGKQGANRLTATGLMARTPNGVWVPLTGQTFADDLGRAGLPGEVNNRYAERFGAATLLTVGDMATQVIQAEASKGGDTYLSLNSGGGGVQQLMQSILQSQANLPPLFTKHQGEMIALFIDQPISFASSYKIHLTAPRTTGN